MNKKFLIFIGMPGSGKGTQGALISKQMEIEHISLGDVLRSIINTNHRKAKYLSDNISKGKLVSDDVINELMLEYIESDKYKTGCILDGYPRKKSQLEFLQNKIGNNFTAIYFKIDEQELENRILNRYICANCGKIFNKNIDGKIDKCTNCGSTEFKVRKDDNSDSLKERVKSFNKEILPLLHFLDSKNMLITVDAAKDKSILTEDIVSLVK